MSTKTKAVGAAIVLVSVGTVVTVANNPDVFHSLVNPKPSTEMNYDDGPERITVQLGWGKGQLAEGYIQVNSGDYLNRTLDSVVDKGGTKPVWILRLNKGDHVYARITPRLSTSGSSCSITDPKHPEMMKIPAITANIRGASECNLNVLG